jgi:hypothetical protein
MERPARRSPYLGPASALIGAILAASPVSAHEFWIEPADFSLEADAEIQADLRVGQDFRGDAFPYIPSRFAAFEKHDRLGEADVEGVTGDLPALDLLPRTEGLSIFTYVSAGERIRFRAWDKFQSYLDYEGLDSIPALHDARGLPRDDIREIYTRCAKTLVSVGNATADQDRTTGMRLELVAGENPLTLTPGDKMGFTLMWEGKPLPDTQVALFYKGERQGPSHPNPCPHRWRRPRQLYPARLRRLHGGLRTHDRSRPRPQRRLAQLLGVADVRRGISPGFTVLPAAPTAGRGCCGSSFGFATCRWKYRFGNLAAQLVPGQFLQPGRVAPAVFAPARTGASPVRI